MLEKKRHEEICKPNDLLDAGQVAEVLSENSGKIILVSNVAGITKRHGIQPVRKVGGNNLYLYDDVKDIVVRYRPGRPLIGLQPLTAAERMQRKRAGIARKNNRRVTACHGSGVVGLSDS